MLRGLAWGGMTIGQKRTLENAVVSRPSDTQQSEKQLASTAQGYSLHGGCKRHVCARTSDLKPVRQLGPCDHLFDVLLALVRHHKLLTGLLGRAFLSFLDHQCWLLGSMPVKRSGDITYTVPQLFQF